MVLADKNESEYSDQYGEEYGIEPYEEVFIKSTDYELSEAESEDVCRTFTLLDVDGDGILNVMDQEKLLLALGRVPLEKDLDEMRKYSHGVDSNGMIGMTFMDFKNYITKQLMDTSDEETLRKAFKVFDSTPPTGKIDVNELRYRLKRERKKMTDDEIDFLYKEEDYWMLEEKNMFEYEKLIKKIMGKPCESRFLHC